MAYFKKFLIVGVLGVLCMAPFQAPVNAKEPDYSQLNAETRAMLLDALIERLAYLQEQLALLKAKENTIEEPQAGPSPVTSDDYTKGDEDARLKIITFTDFDCPFCKQFHTTLNRVVENYDDVSITYRHFPLEQLHPNAKELSIAAECVGQLKGDQAFYRFVDSVFNLRALNDRTDMSKLNTYARSAGVNNADFTTCRESQAAEAAVSADMIAGTAIGIQGTPISYIFRDDEFGVINGAQPYLVVQEIIDKLLE